jgi:hypothetical protein
LAECEAFSQHGFYGKESETVEQTVNWMVEKAVSGADQMIANQGEMHSGISPVRLD